MNFLFFFGLFASLHAQWTSADTSLPLPEERTDAPVCDDNSEYAISLMTQQSMLTGSYIAPDECEALVFDLNGDLDVVTQCDCYTSGVNVDDLSSSYYPLYYKTCRLGAATPYLISDLAMYCNDNIMLIGETD